MKARELDKIFDDEKIDITEYLNLSKAVRPGHQQKRIKVDFPIWMIEKLDREAKKIGVSRQSLIKVFIAERLKKE